MMMMDDENVVVVNDGDVMDDDHTRPKHARHGSTHIVMREMKATSTMGGGS